MKANKLTLATGRELAVWATLILPTIMLPAAVTAAEDAVSLVNKKMEHVLVTVPIHRSEAETALPVTVFSGDELRNVAANSLGETLMSTPGLASASFGPAVGQPVIRGQQGPRVTVLQNSTSSADVANSSADHAVSVEPVLAESIEILRGPATLLYGGGAIGGVINVIDKRVPVALPEQLSGAAEMRHASTNDENTGVFSLDWGLGSWAFHLDGLKRESNNLDIPGLANHHAEHEEEHEDAHDDEHEEEQEGEHEETTDGFIANTDTDTESFTVGSSYFFDKGFIGLAFNRLDNSYGIPGGAHTSHDHEEHEEGEEEPDENHEEHGDNVRLDIRQRRYDLRADIHELTPHIDTMRAFLTYSDYEHDELENGSVGTQWRKDSWESRLEVTHREIAGWHGVFGLQLKQAELDTVGDEAYLPQSDTENYGLFVVEDYHYGNWLFELGARFDKDKLQAKQDIGEKLEQDFSSYSFSASAMWQTDKPWRVGVAISQSERAPVVEELFSNAGRSQGDYIEHIASGAIEVGNVGLEQEQANNLDVSLHYGSESLDGFITLFYNDFRDYIYLANTGLEQDEIDVLQYRQQDARFHGVEFELDIALGSLGGGDLSLQFFGDAIQGELNSAGDVPRLPPQRFGSKLSYERSQMDTYLQVVKAAEQNNPGQNEETTEGYIRWDAGVQYRLMPGSLLGSSSNEGILFLRMKNISDEDIRHSTSLLREIAPESGRSVEAGIRYAF